MDPVRSEQRSPSESKFRRIARHRKTSSIISGLNSLWSSPHPSSAEPKLHGGDFDNELIIPNEQPPEWADSSVDDIAIQPILDQSQPVSQREMSLVKCKSIKAEKPAFLSPPKQISSIAFPSPEPNYRHLPSEDNSLSSSPTSSTTSSDTYSGRSSVQSSRPQSPTSAFDTPATSHGFSSPLQTMFKLEPSARIQECLSPPPDDHGGRTTSLPHFRFNTMPTRRAHFNEYKATTKTTVRQPVKHQKRASVDREILSDEDSSTSRERFPSLRARSIQSINSIRDMAAAWVPARFAPSQFTSSSQSDSNPDSPPTLRRQDQPLAPVTRPTAQGQERRERRRPIKLDRRRLDKAVSLAVEAAQAVEEDERTWNQRQVLKSQQQRQTAGKRFLSVGAAQQSEAASALGLCIQGADGQGMRSSQSAQALSSGLSDPHQQRVSEGESSDEDISFSLDLYISSLGYLISALSDKDASGLSEKHRADIQHQLEEGMSKLGFDVKAELAQAEEMRKELELRKENPSVVHHHYHGGSPHPDQAARGFFDRAHAAAKASSNRTTSFAGVIGTSVLDIGLCIGAGAISTLSSNLAVLTPRSVKETKPTGPKILSVGLDAEDQQHPSSTIRKGAASLNSKQWELAVAFASSAASALASSLSSIATQDSVANVQKARDDTDLGLGTVEAPGALALTTRGGEGTAEAAEGPISAEERLILLSASLARTLKRSPLPSQLYHLLKQVLSVLAALEARYSLYEKGTRIALRQTSLALRFVRKHDLHVKAIKLAWATTEAAVAAIEAYRDEKGWEEIHSTQPAVDDSKMITV
ncbi:hypothetical protein IE53DRAFT_372098 [Violaceomyces palustris]|uniref:Uncharacterized protein n=1 Tax=Violaceomyces palustris TaxID=1673888 RepID=A0ACD0NLP9_9BASI|nr:hypothetical protein IE53DRAFT_372098 [Violaceomyces palustris]